MPANGPGPRPLISTTLTPASTGTRPGPGATPDSDAIICTFLQEYAGSVLELANSAPCYMSRYGPSRILPWQQCRGTGTNRRPSARPVTAGITMRPLTARVPSAPMTSRPLLTMLYLQG